ncbi:MAG TPA: hypothetical protein VE619_10440 [Nitrososphaeraceae archaeon]|nr:hypothetical protein [Nitrososphaeraceae archaeon]
MYHVIISPNIFWFCVTVHTRSVKFYGEPGIGKMHLCHMLCVVLPSHFEAVYIDTEGTFLKEKIKSIAKARGLQRFANIQVKTAVNSTRPHIWSEMVAPFAFSQGETEWFTTGDLMQY